MKSARNCNPWSLWRQLLSLPDLLCLSNPRFVRVARIRIRSTAALLLPRRPCRISIEKLLAFQLR